MELEVDELNQSIRDAVDAWYAATDRIQDEKEERDHRARLLAPRREYDLKLTELVDALEREANRP